VIAAWLVSALFIAHAVVFRAATRWTCNRRRLRAHGWQAQIAQAIPGLTAVTAPWYVRYADWLSSGIDRLARRPRPRVTGQVYLVLKPDFSSALRRSGATRPRPGIPSMHGVGRAVDFSHHYPLRWRFTPDGTARPIPLDGGIHPSLYDAGGDLPVGQPLMNVTRHPESVLTAQQWDLAFTSMRNSFAEFAARITAAFNRLDGLTREIEPIYDHRRRREERLAAKNPELTALWTAYRHKTRRRNRRRRNR
jgi:hypothetical protein